MKRVRMIAAALAAASLCMGCSDGTNDDGIPGAPSVSLPESVGENPFEGKTFGYDRKDQKYVFSADGRTMTEYYYNDDDANSEFVPGYQYRYSVDADKKELSWAVEKMNVNGSLRSFEEFASYISSGTWLKDYEEELRKRIGYDITEEEIEEELAETKKDIDKEIANGFPSIKAQFSFKQRFAYTYEAGALDLKEQFEESCAVFEYDNGNYSAGTGIYDAYVNLMGWASVSFRRENNYSRFDSRSFSTSERKIVFENNDDEGDTFTATYELEGDGNSTVLVLSFTYKDDPFKEELAFSPRDLHLTEKAE